MREGVYVIMKADGGRVISLNSTVMFAAAAALDPHDVACDGLSVCAEESQMHCAGCRRLTAPAVHTGAACARPVASSCGASSKCNLLWFPRPHGLSTLLSFLCGIKNNQKSSIIHFLMDFLVLLSLLNYLRVSLSRTENSVLIYS